MATLFRDLSYRYQCLYDAIARLARRVSVGPEARLGQRRLEYFTISAETKVLDFCSSSRQTTQFLVLYSQDVTGLDASPLLLQLAPEKCTISQLCRSFCGVDAFSPLSV